MAKPDLILSSEDGSEVVYVEYKSTSSKQDKWINSWGTAVQLHSTCRAIEQTTGTKVSQVVVQGLYKGYESYGKQNSPFCYCYLKKGHPPFSKDEISYEFKYGFKRSPTWQLPGGLKKWIDDMPDVVLADQFPQTPPIFVKEELVEAFFTQRAIREKEIAKGVQEVSESLLALDEYFPQRFDQCQPSFGFSCPYVPICHGYVTDPLNQGFQEREPHHEEELLRFEARRDPEPR